LFEIPGTILATLVNERFSVQRIFTRMPETTPYSIVQTMNHRQTQHQPVAELYDQNYYCWIERTAHLLTTRQFEHVELRDRFSFLGLEVLASGVSESYNSGDDGRFIDFKTGMMERVVSFILETDTEAEHTPRSFFKIEGKILGS